MFLASPRETVYVRGSVGALYVSLTSSSTSTSHVTHLTLTNATNTIVNTCIKRPFEGDPIGVVQNYIKTIFGRSLSPQTHFGGQIPDYRKSLIFISQKCTKMHFFRHCTSKNFQGGAHSPPGLHCHWGGDSRSPCEREILWNRTCRGVPVDTMQWAVQKWLNRSWCRLGCGLGWPKEACVKWGTHWRNMANTTERPVFGGDAALCQITLSTC